MTNSIKSSILSTINTMMPLDDYNPDDIIFSKKYNIPPTAIVYMLLILSKQLNFRITDDLIDSLEACTFRNLEKLLSKRAASV